MREFPVFGGEEYLATHILTLFLLIHAQRFQHLHRGLHRPTLVAAHSETQQCEQPDMEERKQIEKHMMLGRPMLGRPGIYFCCAASPMHFSSFYTQNR